ncbi:unnamed protein product [Schistocephalus solidus]|uniref:PRP21_like_P domain-containing protein n=1 Tax=Schistocephalus solidus TaxID=70667 RepID=A0A183TQC7_SCHSO|nr:unnamed protein product [Schistocephalus solidus]
MDVDRVPVDEYEEYNYEEDRITGTKGGRNRTKAEQKHEFSDNRSIRIHIEKQINNEDKQDAQRLKSEIHKLAGVGTAVPVNQEASTLDRPWIVIKFTLSTLSGLHVMLYSHNGL